MTVRGALIEGADGEMYWEVEGVDAMRPFLISLVSASDVWAYVSTSGALTAGRVDASRALFPYETDDRLHHAAGVNGPITLIRVGDALWQPFDPRGVAPGRARTLRKAAEGHWLELEERAPDLGLTFRARWATGPRFGLVRRCTLLGDAGDVEVLDGFVNVMPAGVPMLAQQGLSALVDAYKRSELLPSGVALYAMDALLSDQAAPAEALRANVVWRHGLPSGRTCLSADAVADVRAGRPTPAGDLWFGQRAAYLVRAVVRVAGAPVTWDLVGDVHLDHVALTGLLRTLDGLDDASAAIDDDVAHGARLLRARVAAADGLQRTADASATVHHFANVAYNIMRGGVFAHDLLVPVADFGRFLGERNRHVAARHQAFVAGLGARVPHPEFVARAEATGDDHLIRLYLEYLPLTFSRRHGDPSRPWNAFSIRLQGPDGAPIYSYEGNWRDIFQNWEALCQSYPAFLVPVIAKFVNASTLDGFNPYRITRAGVDWEEPDPEDPWANIGYWGDHQIVYLFRLIEAAEAFAPGSVRGLLGRDLFSFADVPYRLRPYDQIVRDAKDTIVFDHEANARARARQADVGGDGRLVPDASGGVRLANLFEKLLIPVLTKLSNLVVDGGIWLNTQRPEWNDANNALVGQGLSIVTLAHLRRALVFLRALVDGSGAHDVSVEVRAWLEAVSGALADHAPLAGGGPVRPDVRRSLLDALGGAFSAYRAAVYAGPSAGRVPVDAQAVVALCDDARAWLDHTLRTSRRPDGLVHSYNLLTLADGEARVGHLYEMLEGQVAVLGSGALDAGEAVALVDALFTSALYRADQGSFLLYPFRDRPRFLDRNRVAGAREVPLLAALLDSGHRGVIAVDADGIARFDASLPNAAALGAALDALAADPAWSGAVGAGREAALAAYEATFDHHAFTGRSGTMYKYEGLGCIYWHMVSKLLVAVQEAWRAAHDAGSPHAAALAERYYRVRAGLSFNKTVEAYGAIPTDPYSHTPWHLGAQQPGMTGQVKEEVLTRLGELGVRVRGGCLSFEPALLRRRELLVEAGVWRCQGPSGVEVEVVVPAGAVGFTVAQVPVVVEVVDEGVVSASVSVGFAGGREVGFPGRAWDAATTAAVFARDGGVVVIRARVGRGAVGFA